MASDQQMIEALSDMLREGDILMHPIFGYVKNGGFQQFAYFGFTETHFLICYLSGDQVADTERIPLEIVSIKVNKNNILKEYTIDILFNNKKEYKISAFSKALKIKSQEENFSLFLEHLKSKAKKQARVLDEIEGEKIRLQYFNTYIYTMLAFLPAVPVMIIMSELRKGNFDVWNIILEMSDAIPVIAAIYGIFIGPFILLSVLNRFVFGKTLGVISEDTLFLENRDIPIKNIAEIIYHPRVMSRRKISFSYATFVVTSNENKKESFDVIHFPMYGLRKIKKYNRKIKLKCDKYVWFLVLCPTVVFAVMGFIFG